MSTETPLPVTAKAVGLRGLLEIRWLTRLADHPWLRQLRAHLTPQKDHSTPEISLITQGNKTLAVGLEWKSIIAAGTKAGRLIARQSDASHMIEYLSQCVGLGRLTATETQNPPVALASLLMRLLQTDRSVLVLHLPGQAKVWALTVNHRRPYGTEALLSYEELGPWLDAHAAQFEYIHSDLATEDLQSFYQADHIFPLSFEQALKSQVFRADQLTSLKRVSPMQLLRKYPALKWGLLVLLLGFAADYGMDEYKAYLAHRLEIQRQVLIESEAPALLWNKQIKGLLDRLPEPDADSMQALVRSMYDLPVFIHGWRLNQLVCKEQVAADKSAPLLAKSALAAQGQTWLCNASYAVDPLLALLGKPASFTELKADLPAQYTVRWQPLKNFELSWTHQRPVQPLQQAGLKNSRTGTLELASLLQQMSDDYRVSTDLKWVPLPMPAVLRSDGSPAPKPKEIELPVSSPLSVQGPFGQLSELLLALPADWRQIEMNLTQTQVGRQQTSGGWPMPKAVFTLKGVVYATE